MIIFAIENMKLVHKQSQIFLVHFWATLLLTYISPQAWLCSSVLSFVELRFKFFCQDTSLHIRPMTETFTSIQVVIPLCIGAEFPDTVVLWLAETSTVGVEL